MQALRDGDKVFVAWDDFVDSQESQAVFGTCAELADAAALAMDVESRNGYFNKFVHYFREAIGKAALTTPVLGKVLRVTIEWVDADEAQGVVTDRWQHVA